MNSSFQGFRDRPDAGRRLSERLASYRDRPDVVVLGLARGGVPVAYEVAKQLQAPLDVFVIRKLGAPGNAELALGAIASGPITVINQDLVDDLHISQEHIEAVTRSEETELKRREHAYREQRKPLDVKHQTVILVDDGMATGSSMRAAVQALNVRRPAWIVVAVPVAPPETVAFLKKEVDAIVCLATPQPFHGVSQWYADFPQTTDREVRQLLHKPG